MIGLSLAATVQAVANNMDQSFISPEKYESIETQNLFSGIAEGNFEKVKEALENGADVNCDRIYGFTPLFLVLSDCNDKNSELFPMARLLVQYGADLNHLHVQETLARWGYTAEDLLPLQQEASIEQDSFGLTHVVYGTLLSGLLAFGVYKCLTGTRTVVNN